MTNWRRLLLQMAAGVAALTASCCIAAAETWPARPVHVIVPFAPAGGADVMARLIGQPLSERTGQQFIIENRPGGAGNIGAEAVVRAPPDGYTLLLMLTPNVVNATLFEKLNFNFIRDIAPVAGISREPNILVIHPSLPVGSVAGFIAYAKANPGRVTMASSGNGSSPHIAGELFKMMTGVNLVHVPYRGGGLAINDLVSGQVQTMFATMSSSIAYVQDGRLRPLAVTTAALSDVLPEVPTVGDVVPGYEASTWYGLGVPQNTPPEIIDKLNGDVNAILAGPQMKARLATLGSAPLILSPAELGKLIVEETEKWAKVVKVAGIKVN
jgi:tripartite-type tricarboxylate transporter receptor subunit TctC